VVLRRNPGALEVEECAGPVFALRAFAADDLALERGPEDTEDDFVVVAVFAAGGNFVLCFPVRLARSFTAGALTVRVPTAFFAAGAFLLVAADPLPFADTGLPRLACNLGAAGFFVPSAVFLRALVG